MVSKHVWRNRRTGLSYRTGAHTKIIDYKGRKGRAARSYGSFSTIGMKKMNSKQRKHYWHGDYGY